MTDKITEIIARLNKLYPAARSELRYRNPLQLLVATILSAQCTDERVNKVTEQLFLKYQKPQDYLKVPLKELEADIHSTGFYKNKAKAIRGSMERLLEYFGGEVPASMEAMLTLPGVARKTANVVLANAFSLAEGIAVDTHVSRVSQRLGLTANKTPEKIEPDLMKLIPREKWIDFNHQLILLGRQVCKARKPEHQKCPLTELCDFYLQSISGA